MWFFFVIYIIYFLKNKTERNFIQRLRNVFFRLEKDNWLHAKMKLVWDQGKSKNEKENCTHIRKKMPFQVRKKSQLCWLGSGVSHLWLST